MTLNNSEEARKIGREVLEKKRFDSIDLLKTLCIIGVIAIHTAAFNLGNSSAYFFWNYLQFVVAGFIFCSGYVLSNIFYDGLQSFPEIFAWWKKRLLRLLLPFYVYVICHYALWIIFPGFFSGFGLNKNFSFLVNSFLLTGGVDLNWLPLLFLQLTFILPFLARIKNNKIIFGAYLFFCILVTGFVTFISPFHQYYRLLMWIPWSLVLLYAVELSKKEYIRGNVRQKKGVVFGILLFALFIFLSFYNSSVNFPSGLRDHKYPPDFYFLSYSLSLTLILFALTKQKIFSQPIVKRVYYYLSTNSYSLFFTHIIVLDFTFKNLNNSQLFSNWFVKFIFILLFSVFINVLFNKAIRIMKSHNKASVSEKSVPVKGGFWDS